MIAVNFIFMKVIGKETKFAIVDKVLSELQLVKCVSPFPSATLDFTIIKYGDDQIHGFVYSLTLKT